MIMQMGIGMEGLEDRILGVASKIAGRFDEVTYVEIGVGEGGTLTGIASALKGFGIRWRAVGIELPNGYSFSQSKTRDFALMRDLRLFFITPKNSAANPTWDAVTVYFKDSQSFLTEHWQGEIHLALIDGCHGKPCVIQDFLAIEAFMPRNGILMFHDFAADQVGHFQPHCPTGLDVRGACRELGLLNGKRTDWKFEGEWGSKRELGGWDMGIFSREKVNNG